ncbi:MAG: hypothetical protein V4598_01680 [Bdellovibrionota bacterium]
MKLVSTLLLALSLPALADVCSTSSAPNCPASGVKILDDTYPIQSFVISQQSFSETNAGRELPRRAMMELLRAYNFSPENSPNIIYPAGAEDFGKLKTELIAELVSSGMTEAAATSLVQSRVRHVEALPYTWQQDYFEASFNPATGQPRVNYSQIYAQRDAQEGAGTRASFNAIAATNLCGLTAGDELLTAVATPQQKFLDPAALQREAADTLALGTPPTQNAEFGGNIEGLPGGLCLVGNNMTERFANQICGPSANIVRAEVAWLSVGHVDEVFKVVPDRRQIDGRPRECAFSIFSADTELGLSLLKSPGALNQATLQRKIDPRFTAGFPGMAYDENYQRSVSNPPAMRIICPILNEAATPAVPSAPGGRSAPARVRGAMLELLLIGNAHAQDAAAPVDAADANALRCARNGSEVTNRQFTAAVEALPDLVTYNVRIQEALVRSRTAMYNAILGRLPQCRPFFRTMDDMFTKVPNYFSPPSPQEAGSALLNGQLRNPGAFGNSFFPNPTNSVIANNTLLYPGPVPQAYREYLDGKTRALGLTPTHLDTWDYAHTGSGNIHCSSHSIPYCRPAGGTP